MNKLQSILIIITSLILAFIVFWRFVFLRNPDRKITKGNNIISSADGEIIDILKFNGKNEIKFFKGNKKYLGIIETLTKDVSSRGYIISVFMTPLNVHYNRAPIAGKVISIKHSPGKLLRVNTIEIGLLNEKTEILIHGKIKLKVIQIAGLIARRIETFVKKDEDVNKGEIIGLINLGSQVTIILPDNVRIKVKKGDKVKAGETVIADILS